MNPLDGLDFLPDVYRDRYRVRFQHAWTVTVFLVFGGAIGMSFGVQAWISGQTERRMAETEAAYRKATEQSQRLARLHKAIDQIKDRAVLLAVLRRRWPLTRMVHATLTAADGNVTIQSWKLRRTRQKPDRPEGRRAAPDARSRTRRVPHGVRGAVETIAGDQAGARHVIEIEGTAPDVARVYTYVGRLSRCPLLRQVELVRIGAAENDAARGNGVRFRIRIEVRSVGAPPPGLAPAAAPGIARGSTTPGPPAPLAGRS